MLDEKGKVEGEVVAVKKALCILLAAIFVCSVYVHGSGERFSLEAMITNLTNFQDMPSLEDFATIWTENYYDKCSYYDYPYWVDYYQAAPDLDGEGTVYLYSGRLPLAYNADGSLKEDVEYYWTAIRNDGGFWLDTHPHNVVDNDWRFSLEAVGCYVPEGVDLVKQSGEYAVVKDSRICFESYAGEDPILEFFDDVKGFFMRLYATVIVVCDVLFSALRNVQYFLPWNNTVPKEV